MRVKSLKPDLGFPAIPLPQHSSARGRFCRADVEPLAGVPGLLGCCPARADVRSSLWASTPLERLLPLEVPGRRGSVSGLLLAAVAGLM